MSEAPLSEGSALATLEELGAMQWGLITTAQAQQAGIERIWLSRLVRRGVLHRIRHGVYALPSATHGSLQDLQAAWLTTDRAQTLEERIMGDNNVVVSHISAANVHQLGDLVSTRYEFSSPQRRQTAQQDIHFYRRQLTPDDIVLKDGLPVTSAPRTIADLAAIHVDFDHLAQVVRDALNQGMARFPVLASYLEPSARAYGYNAGDVLMDALIDEAGLPATAESLMSRNLASAWHPRLSQALDELNNPKLAANLRESLKSVMPAFHAAYEKSLSELVSELVKSHLPEAETLDPQHLQSPGQSAIPKKTEEQAVDDEEANEP